MIMTIGYSGGWHHARYDRPCLQVRKVCSHMGASNDTLPEDMPQLQQPVLEHAEG